MNELSCEAMRLRNLHVEILHGVYTVLDKAIEAGSILKESRNPSHMERSQGGSRTIPESTSGLPSGT